MYELQALRESIDSQDYQLALRLIDELDEMYLDCKLNKIYNYLEILLMHLIKQAVEDNISSSWERTIINSIEAINRTNKKIIAGGYYFNSTTLQKLIDEAFPKAIREAFFEVFEGNLSTQEVESQIKPNEIKTRVIASLDY